MATCGPLPERSSLGARWEEPEVLSKDEHLLWTGSEIHSFAGHVCECPDGPCLQPEAHAYACE